MQKPKPNLQHQSLLYLPLHPDPNLQDHHLNMLSNNMLYLPHHPKPNLQHQSLLYLPLHPDPNLQDHHLNMLSNNMF